MTNKFSITNLELATCRHFGIALRNSHGLYGDQKHAAAVRRRWVFWMLARDHTRLSFPQLGTRAGLHHSTVLHGAQRAAALCLADANFAFDVAAVARLAEQLEPPPEPAGVFDVIVLPWPVTAARAARRPAAPFMLAAE